VALALDGSVHGSTSGTSLGVNLTTTGPGLIFVAVENNDGTPTSVVASGLTFNLRVDQSNSGTPALHETVYVAVSSGAVSGLTITVNLGGSAFITVDAWGLAGSDTSTIWDPDAGLPVKGDTDPLSIDTDNANDFIYGALRGSVFNPTAGAGWTAIQEGDYHVSEYQIVSATQTGLSVTLGTGSGGNGAVADAVMEAGSTPPVNPDILFLRR